MDIGRIFLRWKRKISLPSELTVRLKHSCLSICDDWVAETWHINAVPSTAKHDVTHQNLVFESRSECSWSLGIFNGSLNTTPYAWDCLDWSSSELSHLNSTREHAFNKRRVLEYFIGLADELELLHHFELRVHLNDDASRADPEVRRIAFWEVLYPQERCSYSKGWSIKDCIAVAKLRSVLDHSHRLLSLNWVVFHRVDRNGLELAPADGESNRVAGFKDMWVPSVLLDLDSHEGKVELLMFQGAKHNRKFGFQLAWDPFI